MGAEHAGDEEGRKAVIDAETRLNQSKERSERTVVGSDDVYRGGSGASAARIVEATVEF